MRTDGESLDGAAMESDASLTREDNDSLFQDEHSLSGVKVSHPQPVSSEIDAIDQGHPAPDTTAPHLIPVNGNSTEPEAAEIPCSERTAVQASTSTLDRAKNAALLGAIVAVIVAVSQIVTSVALERRASSTARESTREVLWRQVLNDSNSARIVGADLSGLDLSSSSAAVGADLSEISGQHTDFSNSQLVESNFSGAELQNANFSDARLRDSLFITASVDRTSFEAADLRGASFAYASVGEADFSDAFLTGADFRGVDLSRATFSALGAEKLCYDDETQFLGDVRPVLDCETPTSPNGTDGAGYRMQTAIRRAGQTADEFTSTRIVTAGQRIEVRVWFVNDGITVDDVSILLENQSGNVTFVDVEVDNSNNPDGFSYEIDAIQGDGSTVNAGIGDYAANSDAYLYAAAVFDPVGNFECGWYQFAVTAYVTPLGLGTLNDSAFLIAELGC